MKFTVEKNFLLSAITTASRASAAKSAVPALEGLLKALEPSRSRNPELDGMPSLNPKLERLLARKCGGPKSQEGKEGRLDRCLAKIKAKKEAEGPLRQPTPELEKLNS